MSNTQEQQRAEFDALVDEARNKPILDILAERGVEMRKSGKEFFGLCPFHNEHTPSFTVTSGTNAYRCMGCGAEGDGIKFVREFEGLGFRDAVYRVLGKIEPARPLPVPVPAAKDDGKGKSTRWVAAASAPADVPPPEVKSFEVRAPQGGSSWEKRTATARWAYRTADGAVAGYAVRFEYLDDAGKRKKDVVPQVWATDTETGEQSWRWLSMANPRPLYNLDKLAQYPDAQVLVVEGEKTADAAAAMLQALNIKEHVVLVTTWPGGSKAIRKVDWSPLKGRRLAMWPDADLSGVGLKAMITAHDVMLESEVTLASCRFVPSPDGVDDGWDLADPVPEGFSLLAQFQLGTSVEVARQTLDAIEQAIEAAKQVSERAAASPLSITAEDPAPEGWADPGPAPEEAPFVDFSGAPPTPPAAKAPKKRKASQPQPPAPPLDVDGLGTADYFTPKGYNHDRYFFFAATKKQLMPYSRADMTETGLLQLAPLEWWRTHFTDYKGGYSKADAVDFLIRRCHAAGIFNPRNIRGRGAWIDPDGVRDRVVLHLGSHLVVDGVVTDIVTFQPKTRFIYELDDELPPLSPDSMTQEEGLELFDLAHQFRWQRSASAVLLLGWIALAPLCGALRWRPHLFITGGAGSGKSTVLNEFVLPLLNSMQVFAQGNSTEAGLRQELKSDALPVLFDEAESNEDRDAIRMQGVLSLIRQASSESSARTIKGTSGGQAQHYLIRSMFCLSAILPAIKQQADLERLTKLVLRSKHETNDAAGEWEALRDRLYVLRTNTMLPAKLVRRSVDLLQVTLKNITVFSSAAAGVFGSQRDGDQYGTLLAGAWSLVRDNLVTPEEAREFIGQFGWDDFKEHVENDEPTRCLMKVLEYQLKDGTLSVTIYELVGVAAGLQVVPGVSVSDAERMLDRIGMRVYEGRLVISNKSEALAKLLAGTQYATGARDLLKRLPGVNNHGNRTVAVGPVRTKVLSIPLELCVSAETNWNDSPI